MHASGSKCSLDESCATVVFLRNAAVVSPGIYLAKKKQNIHTNDGKELSGSTTWNGYGGKWKKGDKNIFDTAKRELYEESGVRVLSKDLMLGAQIEFFWPGNHTEKRDMEVFFFTAYKYSDYPVESDAMGKPELFTAYDAPFTEMMPADSVIVPLLLSGKTVKGRIYFAKSENGMVVDRTQLGMSPILGSR